MAESRIVRTVCDPNCHASPRCGISAHVVDGRIDRIEAGRFPLAGRRVLEIGAGFTYTPVPYESGMGERTATMSAAFVYDFIKFKDHISADRIAEIGVGFLFAFLSALVVVKPFLNFVTRVGFGPFAWYRIGLGALMLGAMAIGTPA